MLELLYTLDETFGLFIKPAVKPLAHSDLLMGVNIHLKNAPVYILVAVNY